MRTRRTYRPTLDTALEDRTALSLASLSGLAMQLTPYQGVPASRGTTPAALTAMHPAPTAYVLAGTLAPHIYTSGSLGSSGVTGGINTCLNTALNAGPGSALNTALGSGLSAGLTSSLNAALGSALTGVLNGAYGGLGTYLNSAYGGLNSAYTSLGTSLNTASTGLGSSLNTGTFNGTSPVTQYIAGLAFPGTGSYGSTVAGIPSGYGTTAYGTTAYGSPLGTTADNGTGLGTTGAYGGLYGSSAFMASPYGMGYL